MSAGRPVQGVPGSQHDYAAERMGYRDRHQPCGRPPKRQWAHMCPRAKLGWDQYLRGMHHLQGLRERRHALEAHAKKTPLDAQLVKEHLERLERAYAKMDALADTGAEMLGAAKFRCPCTTPKCDQWAESVDARGKPSGAGGWMVGAGPF